MAGSPWQAASTAAGVADGRRAQVEPRRVAGVELERDQHVGRFEHGVRAVVR